MLCVKPGDHATHWRKVDEVLSVVDRDLGFSEVGIRWPDKTKVFMYIADKKVVGLLLAETIDRAYRIIPNNGNIIHVSKIEAIFVEDKCLSMY